MAETMESVHYFFWVLAYVVAVAFLLSGLDDFFFDLQFVRYLYLNRNRPHITVRQLKNKPEQWIAVFVPAWMEGGVVNRMAEYAAKVLHYEKYDIFIGVYPNDAETCACVDKVAAECPRIHKVLVPHDGPTSKADCLNWIYRAMRLREIPGVREYAMVCLHDSEDILHPLTLKIYNWFVPESLDMAQIPVFPLELNPWRFWVGNTYMDEFCELHMKDMFARQQIGGVVPSAGVGTAFGRRALEELGRHNDGDPFRIGNLTEDYEIGIRLKRAGFRSAFVNYPIDRIVRKQLPDGRVKERIVTEAVAVRENFPSDFLSAVKQRSRWILGIAFQTWEQTGWSGSLPVRYTLFRDRRAPLVHVINAMGYAVFIYAILSWLAVRTPWGASLYVKPLFDANTLLWKIVVVDSYLLLYRFFQKFYCVNHIFGWVQGLFSAPRFFVNNAINFCATMRAFRMYINNRFFGKPLVWLKTTHVFPGQQELAEYSHKIEDLFVQDGLVTREQIDAAMAKTDGESVPIVLLKLGLIDEKQFTDTLCQHAGMTARLIHPYKIPTDLLEKFPEEKSLATHAVPVGLEEERVVMAFREPPREKVLEELQSLFGMPLKPVLARPSNIGFTRNRAYLRLLLAPPSHRFFSEQLMQMIELPEARLHEALYLQHQTRHSLADVLVDMGAIPQETAREAWAASIGSDPVELAHVDSSPDILEKIGNVPCLLHHLVPLEDGRVATASPIHPGLDSWLQSILGTKVRYVGDLPRNVEGISRVFGMAFDADQSLLGFLSSKGILDNKDLVELHGMQQLIADPVSEIIRQLRFATEEELNVAFREISRLPVVNAYDPKEVIRLARLLPPEFSERTGCHALLERDGMVTLGLSRMLTSREILTIHERLTGYPLFFQALSFEVRRKMAQLQE